MSEVDTPNNQPTSEPTESTDDSGADLSEVGETSGSPNVIDLFKIAEVKIAEAKVGEESSENQNVINLFEIAQTKANLSEGEESSEDRNIIDLFEVYQTGGDGDEITESEENPNVINLWEIDRTRAEFDEERESSEAQNIIDLFEIDGVNALAEEWHPEASSDPEPTIISEADDGGEEEDSRVEVSETDSEVKNKDADWFALVQKMRERNRRLFEQVNQLKQALKDKQQGLAAELMRSQERDALLAAQTEEIQVLQGQLTRLFQTLESSHQSGQRQQILIETLSEQLQSSQERVAQLERECSLIQQRYNEQSHQLVQEANACRELRIRLQRQQQQTLQFKIALEKCLEMPATTSSEGQEAHYKSDIPPGCLPKNQPIQPWSANSDFLVNKSDINNLWNRPIKLKSFSLPDLELFEAQTVEDSGQLSTISYLDSSQTNIDNIEPSPDNIATEMEVEAQLLAEMTALAQASGLSESVSDLTVEAPSEEGLMLLAQNLAVDEDSISESRDNSVLPEDIEVSREEAESWADKENQEEDEPSDVILPQPNWPSPVIYPLRRPTKKIKSLSAIELPTFPRYRPT